MIEKTFSVFLVNNEGFLLESINGHCDFPGLNNTLSPTADNVSSGSWGVCEEKAHCHNVIFVQIERAQLQTIKITTINSDGIDRDSRSHFVLNDAANTCNQFAFYKSESLRVQRWHFDIRNALSTFPTNPHLKSLLLARCFQDLNPRTPTGLLSLEIALTEFLLPKWTV